MSDKQKALTFILLGSVFWGTSAAVIKMGLQEIPPLNFAFWRFFLTSLLILPILLTKRQIKVKTFLDLTPISLLAAGNIIFFVLGVKLTTATISQLLYAAVPLLTALVLYSFWREKLATRKILGVLLGFIGVTVVVLLPILEKGEKFSGNLLGNILIFTAVILWSFYTVFSKKIQKRYSPLLITSVFILITTIILLPLSLWELKTNYHWWAGMTLTGLFSIIYTAVFVTIGGFLSNQYAIKHGGSVFASLVFYLTPVLAFLTASVLLGERLTVGLVIGGALALLGIFLTTK